MAKYGAKYIKFAPFAASNPEPDSAFPNYGAIITLGGLKTLSYSPEMAEAEAYEDNALGAKKSSFKKCAIDVEVGELSNASAAVVLGATVNSETSNLELGDDDAPWGGIAFYYSTQDKAGNVRHKGVYFPKAQATVQGSDYETTGENVSFKGDKLKFTGAKCNTGAWLVFSPESFTTEAAAKAWVDNMLGGGTYFDIDVQVNGAGAGEAASPIERTIVKSGESFVLNITGTATALYDNGEDVTEYIAAGKYTIAAVTEAHTISVIF